MYNSSLACIDSFIHSFCIGLGTAYFYQARDYYFKDVEDLEPAQAQIYTSSSMVPWNSKSVYACLYTNINAKIMFPLKNVTIVITF